MQALVHPAAKRLAKHCARRPLSEPIFAADREGRGFACLKRGAPTHLLQRTFLRPLLARPHVFPYHPPGWTISKSSTSRPA